MPRKPREKSDTGIYHVILRGVNGKRIFKDKEDYEKIIQVIERYKKISEYEVYAYCLMSNHIHLLMKEGKEELGIVFRRIGASYVYWYNKKYSRTGHLFQDRYKSEPVEDDEYFLTVLRYIHQNPIKAGIEKAIGEYPWTSYNEYLGIHEICNTKFALNFFAEDERKSKQAFREFTHEANNDICLEHKELVRLNDKEAGKIIKELYGIRETNEIGNFEKNKRDDAIRKFKDIGLSIRQIERLTGVSFSIVRRI